MIQLIHFQDFINITQNDSKICVYVSASWCRPCRMIKPVFETYMEDISLNENQIVCMLDYDVMQEEDEWKKVFGDMKIPAFFIFQNGKCIEKKMSSQWNEIEIFIKEKFIKNIQIENLIHEDF
jgi:thiol-disulfide isomerase/thioredoxin